MKTALIIFNILFPISCISISCLFKKQYPKNINPLIGYRTRRSMASQEAWLFSNKYSSALLFKYSIITVIIQVIAFILIGSKFAITCALTSWVLLIFTALVQTELKLKKRFK